MDSVLGAWDGVLTIVAYVVMSLGMVAMLAFFAKWAWKAVAEHWADRGD